MNERIKELAEQATEHDYTTWDSYNQKELVYYKFNKEKFAELIVRECAKIANEQFTAATGLDDRDCLVAAEMKQRFGVEEVLLK